jgi:hypothetical protein
MDTRCPGCPGLTLAVRKLCHSSASGENVPKLSDILAGGVTGCHASRGGAEVDRRHRRYGIPVVRCQAMTDRGRQCRRNATPGLLVCTFHGAGSQAAQAAALRELTAGEWLASDPRPRRLIMADARHHSDVIMRLSAQRVRAGDESSDALREWREAVRYVATVDRLAADAGVPDATDQAPGMVAIGDARALCLRVIEDAMHGAVGWAFPPFDAAGRQCDENIENGRRLSRWLVEEVAPAYWEALASGSVAVVPPAPERVSTPTLGSAVDAAAATTSPRSAAARDDGDVVDAEVVDDGDEEANRVAQPADRNTQSPRPAYRGGASPAVVAIARAHEPWREDGWSRSV